MKTKPRARSWTRPGFLPVPAQEWADPGYFAGTSKVGNSLRVLTQLIKPPEGHRTLPTMSGMILILLSLGIGTAAYNTSSNILFISLSLLLSSLLLSGLLSWQNFRGVRWRLRTESHARAGEPLPVRLEVENTKGWLPSYGFQFNVAAQAAGLTAALRQEDRLDPGQKHTLNWLVTPPRRGVETLLVASLESQFPFGFLRKLLPGRSEQEVVVWPSRTEVNFRPPSGPGRRPSGPTRLKHGAGTELVNLRPYVPGDAPRLVHWKASARLGSLMVREMAEEQQEAMLIWVEGTADRWSDPATFERLCSAAATLAEDLHKADRLRATAVNDEPVRPGHRVGDLHAFLDRLARLEPVPGLAGRPPLTGTAVITFHPGPGGRIHLHVDGVEAGTA